MHPGSDWLEQLDDCCLNCCLGLALNLSQARQLGLALNDRDDGLLMVLADDRIDFPVTNSLFIGDHGGALINAFAIGDLAAPVVLAIAFATLLLTTQMLVKVAALALVGIDVLIDMLMASRRLTLLFERAADLFRRPILFEPGVNLLPGFRGNAGGIGFHLAAQVSQMLRLFGAIAALTAI